MLEEREATALQLLSDAFTHEDMLMLIHMAEDLTPAEQLEHVRAMDEKQFERIHDGFHTLQDNGWEAARGMDVIRGMFCARNLGLL